MKIEYAILFFCILNTLLSGLAFYFQQDMFIRCNQFEMHMMKMQELHIEAEKVTTKSMDAVADILFDLLTEMKKRGRNNGVEESNVQ